MKKEYAIRVKDLHKSFKLPTEKSTNLKQTFINWTKGVKGYEEQKVLKGVSFDIEKGDFLGIVGRNGSGKSTLLKILAGIYEPDNGSVKVNGTLVPFIELGVGFNPELTGRENIFMNGALLGFSTKEVEEMYDEIVDFAELHEFMNQKLKNYSSGMQVRLAFSIAIKAQGDILVLDEVLAVGDEAFQRKCYGYFARLKREKKTVILVTHSMDNVTRFCNKAIMIDHGKIIEASSVKSVSEKYIRMNAAVAERDPNNQKKQVKPSDYANIDVTLKDDHGVEKQIFSNDKEDGTLQISSRIRIKKDIDKACFSSIMIKNSNGEVITWISSENIEGGDELFYEPRKGDTFLIETSVQNIFGEGDYTIAVTLKSIDRSEFYIDGEDKAAFSIVGLGRNGWSLRPKSKAQITKGKNG